MLIPLPNAYADAADNMAIDLSLLQTVPKAAATFRHYAWVEPTITFGYTQPYKEVQDSTDKECALCRRPTGGGIVDHRNDWTYALILQTEAPPASIPPTELYLRVHMSLQRALQSLSIDTQLAPCPRNCPVATDTFTTKIPVGISECFRQPVANDVLTPNGQKIAGAALKRTREGILLQGSIDRNRLPADFDYAKLQQQLIEQLAKILELPIHTEIDLRTLFNGPLIKQLKQRFKSEDWFAKR